VEKEKEKEARARASFTFFLRDPFFGKHKKKGSYRVGFFVLQGDVWGGGLDYIVKKSKQKQKCRGIGIFSFSGENNIFGKYGR
jgi:hypothetical protein